MRNSSFAKLYILSIIVLLIVGCSIEGRKDAAADRARDYIFENIPRMTPQNAAYIRCTYPKLVTASIYTTNKMSDKNDYWNWGYDYYSQLKFSRSRQFSQVAFTWDLPDPKVSVMVIGTCYDNYQGWYPIKLILRPTALTTTGEPIPPPGTTEADTFFKPVVGKSPSDKEFDEMQLPD
ncbi:MAG TPA: hypothetical protein DD381_14545 [Lentisphaeria bacterium]|nr:MAG: hypothetical protein A2X47_01365 [Lentisphaerae bacterium GWF2_38_69]HBM17544.1 hypothetical protein [Lentisphaeria bacterium]